MTFKIEELTSDILTSHLDDFIETLNNLVPTEVISLEKAQEVLQKINAQDTHIYVALHDDGHLVGSISLMIEQKFIRGAKIAGHLEDVVTKKWYEGQGIASALINHSIQAAKDAHCYKIILDCDAEMIPYYEKFGFTNKGIFMGQYISL